MASFASLFRYCSWIIVSTLVCVDCSTHEPEITDPTFKQLLERVNVLEDHGIKQQRLITDLQRDFDLQKQVNTGLRNDLEIQQKFNIELRKDLDIQQRFNIETRNELKEQQQFSLEQKKDLEKLHKFNTELRNDLEKQHKFNTKLRNDLEKEQQANMELRKDLNQLKQFTTGLERKLDDQENLIAELQIEPPKLDDMDEEKTEQVMERRKKDTEKGSFVQHKRPRTKRSTRRVRQVDAEVVVAFSAGLSKSLSNIGADQNIVFDNVEINTGNGYNPHHGIFVAPVAGTYVFFTTLYASHSYGHTVIFGYFAVNGIHRVNVYSEGTSTTSGSASQMLITTLKQGDDVALQTFISLGNIYGSSNIFSTFSGFMLKQNYSDSNVIVG